jgi:hypothetical protein
MTIVPRATRRYSRLDWVKFDFDLARDGSVDPTDKALYAAIASFVDMETRESPETADVDLNGIPRDVPTRKRLAACIGRSLDTVDRATKRLEDRGLLRVHRQEDPDNPKLSLPSEYELLDHELWDQRAAERAANRAARRGLSEVPADERGSRTGAATPRSTHAATPGRMGAAVEEEREVKEEKRGEKVVGDGRRPGAGSSKRSSGGFAASGKTNPPPLTTEQRQQVRAVFEALPTSLAALVPGNLPGNLQHAVLDALAAGSPASRTPQQLIEFRLMPKWHAHYGSQDGAGRLEKPVGALIAMLRRDAECGNDRCDERTNVDSGEACRSCEMRSVDRRADRVREQQHSSPQEPTGGVPGPRTAPAPVPVAVRQSTVVVDPSTAPLGDSRLGAARARAGMVEKALRPRR